MTTCGICGDPCETPTSIEVDPICPRCISRMAPATTIADCGHILDNAFQGEDDRWYCAHRAHGADGGVITLDPLALGPTISLDPDA